MSVFKLDIDDIPSVFGDNTAISVKTPVNRNIYCISPININYSGLVDGWVPYDQRDPRDWDEEYYEEDKYRKYQDFYGPPPITLEKFNEYLKKTKSNGEKILISPTKAPKQPPTQLPKQTQTQVQPPTHTQPPKQTKTPAQPKVQAPKQGGGWSDVGPKKKAVYKPKVKEYVSYNSSDDDEKEKDSIVEDSMFDFYLAKYGGNQEKASF
jgi:hypothetical protein